MTNHTRRSAWLRGDSVRCASVRWNDEVTPKLFEVVVAGAVEHVRLQAEARTDMHIWRQVHRAKDQIVWWARS